MLRATRSNAVMYYEPQQQLYLSTNSRVDLFSVASNQFVTPLTPPVNGTEAVRGNGTDARRSVAGGQPDGGSLAVINSNTQTTVVYDSDWRTLMTH